MAVYVSDLLTAIPAPVDVAPASAQTWQWLRSSTAISGATGGTYTTTLADLGTTLAVTQTETNFLGAASATSANTEVVQAYDPNALFRFSEPGVWFDPNDITTLYKGPTTVGQVTTPGDTVYMMLDKSRGLVLGPELVVNGNFSGGVANWTGAGAPTLSVVDGELEITRTATGYYAFQDFTTVVGRTYVLTGTVRSAATNSVAQSGRITLSTPTIGSVVDSNGVAKQVNFTFIATVTTTQVALGVASGGATGATGDKAYFDNISVKEVPGNHATQPTLASQPTYGIVPAGGRRNNFLYTEDFANGVWVVTLTGVASAPIKTIDSGFSPSGATACRLQFSLNGGTLAGDVSLFRQAAIAPSGSATHSVLLRSFDGISTYVMQLVDPSGNATNITVTGSWQRFQVTGTSAGTNVNYGVRLRGGQTPASSNTADVLFAEPQVETGSIATPYQRVGTTYDVTEAGVPSLGYLYFDGASDFMSTGTITPGIDKMQVFAGVRKLADAVGVITEFSPNLSSGAYPGNFVLVTSSGGYEFASKGTLAGAVAPSGYPAPITNVLTGIGNISGDVTTLRANGVQIATSSADQGTGNYLAYSLYLGYRNATANLYLNGQLFPLIVRFGTNLTAARITATENWMATQTPLQWTVGSGFWNDAYPWSDISAWRD